MKALRLVIILTAIFTIMAKAYAAPVDHVYVSNERLDKLNLDGSLDMNFLAPGIATICRQLSVDGNSGNVWLGCEGDSAVGLFTSGGAVINYVTHTGVSGGSCVDPYGNAWFTNISGAAVVKFGPAGNIINAYSVGGSAPSAVACDSSGNIWTTNSGSPYNISKLANNGSLIGTFSTSLFPRGTAIDSGNNVWVVTNGGYVHKFDNQGNLIGNYGGGSLYGNYIAINQNDSALISRSSANLVTMLSSSGAIIGNFSVSVPQDITIDASGNIWTVQRSLGSVTKLSREGTDLGTFPLSGNSGQVDTGFLHQRFVLGYNSVEGPNVWVPLNGGALAGAVTLNFDYTNSKGNTSYLESGTGTTPPAGFKLGTPSRYYDITSTATHTGNIEVCIGYNESEFSNENIISLFHSDGAWMNVTTTRDVEANFVCGSVTSLSEFGLMEPLEGPIPTVSEWMLILMAAILFVAIVRRVKLSQKIA